MGENNKEIIIVENLVKSYNGNGLNHRVLSNLSFKVKKGSSTLIMGPSGSGKTTLLNILGLIDRFDSGFYSLGNINIDSLTNKEMRQIRLTKIGFVFQTYNLVSSLTAKQNVELPLTLQGIPVKEQEKKSLNLLKMVGLEDKINNLPRQLSSGEQQRVAIARALSIDPVIILADEPTGNLDRKNTENIMELLQGILKKNNITFVCSSHNQKLQEYTSESLILEDGIFQNSK